jgi:hypothetical protein
MDKETINKLVDQRIQQIQADQDRLVEAWQPFITAVDEYLKETEDREMSIYERRNVAQCLENALCESGLRNRSRLFEATTEDNISFLGIQLPVIAALLPSLVLNDIAIVQALDRRIGAVFYLDIQYGSTKGAVTSGDTMLSAKTGHARTEAGRRYASTMVTQEAIASSAGQSSAAGTLTYAPGVNVTNNSIVVKDEDGVTLGTDAATAGTIVSTGNGAGASGSVTAAGVYSLSTDSGNWGSGGITIDYQYQYDLPIDANNDYTGVPEADVNVTQESITALDFPIRSRYSVGASIDLQKAHGINLENEVVKYLGGEVRFTIDHYGVDLIDDASINGTVVAGVTNSPATAITAWNASVGSGQEWLWKKHEFLDRIEEGNNNIIAATLRALASYIVAGNNVARVIKQLPQFQPVANLNKTPPTGPYKIGTLDGRTVIQDPLLLDRSISGSTVSGTNRYILGWRGDNFLMAGFIYAPYIPLFATPTLVTSDLFAQKGFLSAAGFKIINSAMYTYGTITNLGS